MSIHETLRQLRLEKGMTQEQVARQIGVTRQAVSSYESGRTRPDIDTLIRLSNVYETDLDGIIYGQKRICRSMKRIRITGIFLFLSLTVLVFASSALLWSANHFFPLPEGTLSPEEMMILASRQQLTNAWETLDKWILAISLWGFALLLIFLTSGTCTIPWKVKITYAAGLASAILAISALFGAADPIFPVMNYIITPMLVIGRMVLFFVLDLIIKSIRTYRTGISRKTR